MGCTKRTPGPCIARGVDVIFGDDLDIWVGDDPDVIFGIISGECQPPQVVVECAAELPCDEDLPIPGFFYPPVPSLGSVTLYIEGLVATDQLEVMIKEKYKIDGTTIIFGIADLLLQQDEDAPYTVVITAGGGNLIDFAYYTAFVRRVRDGEVSPWVYQIFQATREDIDVLLDGEDIVVDDDGSTVIIDD